MHLVLLLFGLHRTVSDSEFHFSACSAPSSKIPKETDAGGAWLLPPSSEESPSLFGDSGNCLLLALWGWSAGRVKARVISAAAVAQPGDEAGECECGRPKSG